MGEYIYKPIVVTGNLVDVEKAYHIFLHVMTDATEDRHLLAARLGQVSRPTEGANGLSSFLIPPSGGKEGGNIDREWEVYKREWKLRVEEEDLVIQWTDLSLNGPEEDSIVQTGWEYKNAYREEMDST
tara:strand:- start:585 stop:968 length:384 start_codon:yes stop_codon:yes gene_type:complete